MKYSISLFCLTAILFLGACATTTGSKQQGGCACNDKSTCSKNHCPNMKDDDSKSNCGDCAKDTCPLHKS